MSGAFEDPAEVCSNTLTPAELEMLQCDHEEADTRIILHLVKSEKPRAVMYCNDTDVLIACLANYDKLQHKEIFMNRSKNDNINVTGLARGLISLCQIKLRSLPIMFAFSGSDQTSFQYGIGKVKAWNTFWITM